MAHAQKPDFVFPRNGRVHLNRWGRQFSPLLAAELCASAWVMLDRPRSEVAWEYWLPTPFASFPFTTHPVRHHVPPASERALPHVGVYMRVSACVRYMYKGHEYWTCHITHWIRNFVSNWSHQKNPVIYYIRKKHDATLAVLFINNLKNTLHVSDVCRVHHQGYINCSSSHAWMSLVGMMYIQ